MSGRIRTIKPEWLEDELLALASSDARTLSIALMLLADDYGNGRANPLQLAGQVFPGKSPEVAAAALEELRLIRYVTLYVIDGQRYFSIRTWSKHQRVDKIGKNRVPFPPPELLEKPLTEKPPETLAKVPEEPKNIPASRGSEVVVVVGGNGPAPGPDPAVRDSQALAVAALRDPMVTQAKYGNVETWPEVIAVVDAYAATYDRQDRPRHQGDPRARAILGRLAEGHTVAQLEAAVRGSKFAEYIANNRANQALVTILRDSSQVDKFSALKAPATQKQARAAPAPRQPDSGTYSPLSRVERL